MIRHLAGEAMTSVKPDDVRAFLDNGFAYIPSAVAQGMLDQVDLRDVIFHSYNGLNGTVMQTGWFAELAMDELPIGLTNIAEFLERNIETAANSLRESASGFTNAAFNEVTIQVYQPGHGETGAHRDQARYGKSPFVILTLQGAGDFCIRSGDSTESVRTWAPNPGDIFLMRAGENGALHSVPPPRSKRITVSFRYNSLGAKVGGGGTRDFRGTGGSRGLEIGLGESGSEISL
jgi:hypothetical protein